MKRLPIFIIIVIAIAIIWAVFFTLPGRMLIAVTTKAGPCSGLHPVHAYMCGGDSMKPVFNPSMANDKVGDMCLLSLAINYGKERVFSELIANGAKPELCSKQIGQSTYNNLYEQWADSIHCTYAGAREKTRVIFSALDGSVTAKYDPQRLFVIAANRPCTPVLELLLEPESPLNHQSPNGDFLLSRAFGHDFRRKIDINGVGMHGYAPLFSTIRGGFDDNALNAASLLILHGADINSPIQVGSSETIKEWLRKYHPERIGHLVAQSTEQ